MVKVDLLKNSSISCNDIVQLLKLNVAQSPYINHTIFETLAKNKSYLALTVEDQDKLIGVFLILIKKSKSKTVAIFDSRKFSIALLHSKNQDQILNAIDSLCTFLKRAGVDEIRFKIYQNEEVGIVGNLLRNGFKIDSANCDFVLSIPRTTEELFEKFSVSRRNEVRQSLKRSTRLEIVEDHQTFIEIFQSIYAKTQLRKNLEKIPEEQMNFLLSNCPHRNVVSFIDSEPVAAVCFIIGKEVAYYHYSALDIEQSKLRPVDRIIFESLEWMMQNGIKKLNFMSTSLDAQSGVFLFKKQWGGQPHVNLTYFKQLTIKSKLIGLVKETKAFLN